MSYKRNMTRYKHKKQRTYIIKPVKGWYTIVNHKILEEIYYTQIQDAKKW